MSDLHEGPGQDNGEPRPYRYSKIGTWVAIGAGSLGLLGFGSAVLAEGNVSHDNTRINDYAHAQTHSVTTVPSPDNITSPAQLEQVEAQKGQDKLPVDISLGVGIASAGVGAIAIGIEEVRRHLYIRSQQQ